MVAAKSESQIALAREVKTDELSLEAARADAKSRMGEMKGPPYNPQDILGGHAKRLIDPGFGGADEIKGGDPFQPGGLKGAIEQDPLQNDLKNYDQKLKEYKELKERIEALEKSGAQFNLKDDKEKLAEMGKELAKDRELLIEKLCEQSLKDGPLSEKTKEALKDISNLKEAAEELAKDPSKVGLVETLRKQIREKEERLIDELRLAQGLKEAHIEKGIKRYLDLEQDDGTSRPWWRERDRKRAEEP